MPWGKAMMWIFLLSDTFIFSCFLVGYMKVRMSTTDPWPNPSEVFGLKFGGEPSVPLLLIAIMTFILITSSGTMALAVNMGYRKNKKKTFWLMVATAVLGASFVGMQAFEWTKLIVGRRTAMGKSFRCCAVWFQLLHDHRVPWHARVGGRYLFAGSGKPGQERVSTKGGVAIMKSSRSLVCTGTLSTSSGYSFSHFSIFGNGELHQWQLTKERNIR